MARQAQGRVTFTKIVDGRTLNFILDVKAGCKTTQVVTKADGDGHSQFSPDYTKNPLEILTVLTVSGSGGENMINGTCEWWQDGEKIVSGQKGFTVGSAKPYSLKLAANPTTANSMIKCKYTYTEADTKAKIEVFATIPLAQVESPGAALLCDLDRSTIIFRTEGGVVKSESITGVMKRGNIEDKTNVKYQWFIQGTNGAYFEITGTTAPAGSGLPAGNLFTGANTNKLTLNNNAILNIGYVKLRVTDTDPSSATYNKSAEATCAVTDLTDPFDFDMEQPLGGGVSGSGVGKPLLLVVKQHGKVLADDFYNGKKLGFYRITAANGKDATWAPPASDFPGWGIANGEITRSYSGNSGTSENRTVTIKYLHLLATEIDTTFEGFLDF